MTLPARDRPGPLGILTVPNGGTGEFRDFRSSKPITKFTLSLRTNRAITLSVYRIDSYGRPSLHVAPISVPAMSPSNDEQTTVLDYPLAGQGLRFVVSNASGAPATVQGEIGVGGEGSAGIGG